MTSNTHRVRIRFRVAKNLHVAGSSYEFKVGGRNALLQTSNEETAIKDSEWLVVNTCDFLEESEARAFGRNLQASLHLASAITRLGIDPGINRPTASLSSSIKQQIAEKTGAQIRDSIHGLDVFLDEPNVHFFEAHGTGGVLSNPTPFLTYAAELHDAVENMSKEALDVVLLLNFALMRPEPVAKIVFSISAVEMLGQQEDWSEAQREMLDRLAGSVMEIGVGTAHEREEVMLAIKRGAHRISLRQGVIRLLNRLNLSHLKKPWDALYEERSKLVHGMAPVPGARYDEFAARTVDLCGRILLTRIALEVPAVAKYLDTHYPLPTS
jgi:hypothetical protein